MSFPPEAGVRARKNCPELSPSGRSPSAIGTPSPRSGYRSGKPAAVKRDRAAWQVWHPAHECDNHFQYPVNDAGKTGAPGSGCSPRQRAPGAAAFALRGGHRHARCHARRQHTARPRAKLAAARRQNACIAYRAHRRGGHLPRHVGRWLRDGRHLTRREAQPAGMSPSRWSRRRTSGAASPHSSAVTG